ncbi:MAG TPA: M14-type cytosolic carboxypeptidase, partial [Wenzhouxiangella sp.]
MSLSIYSAFDGGNIEVIDASKADQIRLEIRPDAGDRHFQWFYYQVCDAAGMDLSMVIENAGKTSFAEAFKGYQAVASHDQVHWFRVPTEFDGERLTIEHTPEADIVYYAFFEPYSHIRHLALLAEAQASEAVSIESLCATPDGHAHSLITATESTRDDPTIVWVTARQHPGEPMAQWWVEGFLDRLLDSTDAVSRALLAQCVFYVVPNM